jgi:hypothetical protein
MPGVARGSAGGAEAELDQQPCLPRWASGHREPRHLDGVDQGAGSAAWPGSLADLTRIPGTATLWGAGSVLRSAGRSGSVICAYPKAP